MCHEAFLIGSLGRLPGGCLFTDFGLQILAGRLVGVGRLSIKSPLSGLDLPSWGIDGPREALTWVSCIRTA